MKGQESLDPVGVILALAAGACWAGYILFGKKTGNQGSGGATVAMGMTISAIVLVPYGGILQASSFSWDIIPTIVYLAVAGNITGNYCLCWQFNFKTTKQQLNYPH